MVTYANSDHDSDIDDGVCVKCDMPVTYDESTTDDEVCVRSKPYCNKHIGECVDWRATWKHVYRIAREAEADRDSLRARVAELEQVIATHLPHPNGPADTTPGDPDAWTAAMFNLGRAHEERRAALARVADLEKHVDAHQARWHEDAKWISRISTERDAAIADRDRMRELASEALALTDSHHDDARRLELQSAIDSALTPPTGRPSLAEVRAKHGFPPLSEDERRENLEANLDALTAPTGKDKP